MVAKRYAPRRAAAVVLVAILTLTILPVTVAQPPLPDPGTPGAPARDFRMKQGEAYYTQGGVATSFIRNGSSTPTLIVPVEYATGTGSVSRVPVYWFVKEDRLNHYDCEVVDFTETSRQRNVTLSLPSNLPEEGKNITVYVLRSKGPAGDYPGTPGCVANGHLLFSEYPQLCTTGGRSCSADPQEGNNIVNTQYVKNRFLDLRPKAILWCENGFEHPGNCGRDMVNDTTGEVVNMTPIVGCGDNITSPNNTGCFTHFRVLVENRGNYSDPTDYGSAAITENGGGWSYTLNITVTSITGQKSYLVRTVDMRENMSGSSSDPTKPDHFARSANWSRYDGFGLLNVTVTIDPERAVHRKYSGPINDKAFGKAPWWDKTEQDLAMYYREFSGNHTAALLKTTPENPYPYESSFTIAGRVQFNNTGTASTPPGGRASVVVYLDNLSWTDPGGTEHPNTRFVQWANLTLPAKGKEVLDFSWEATNTPGASRYVTPGEHTIHAFADYGEGFVEPNETNNNFSVDIYIQDTTKPTVSNLKTVLDIQGNSESSASTDIFRPIEWFNIYATVVDDDDNVRVSANFTLNSNNSIYRVVNLSPTGPTTFYGHIEDFRFHNFTNVSFNSTENWTMTVTANDSFGNLANASKPFKLKAWPIHNASADFIIERPTSYPHYEIPWAGNEDPVFNIRVLPNATGFVGYDSPYPNQQTYIENLAYNVTTLKKTHNFNGSAWSPKTLMETCGPSDDPGNLPDLPVNTTPVCDETTNNTFEAIFPKKQPDGTAGPGLWNYSIRIKDVANYTRIINGTILINDTPPRVLSSNLSANNVTPNQDVRIRANISDDDNDVTAAHAVFTRATSSGNITVNLTLTTYNQTNGGYFEYNQTFPTGRYQQLGYGGTFNVSIVAKDGTGNWNFSYLGNFTIKDEEPPVLTGYGVIPSAAEVGENVTFWANVSDATNSTVEIRIFKGVGTSELLTPEPIVLNQTGSSNYTYTMNFSTENVYAWTITPIDSVLRVGGIGSGTISVRDNLGPKYDIRGPSTVIDGVRYGSGTPRIEVIVQDVEDVLASSIDMTVAGLPVDFDLLPAPGGIKGYLVSYAVPTTKKFSHNDLVFVNLTAKDNSTEALESNTSFNFTVDDVAPTTRLLSVLPQYRDQPAHVLNVSLNTRFTLAAEDVDGLPTQVPEGGIRYRILGGGTGAAETVYGGPFKINDASGVYTGPRLYQIQFWAEDAVGNFNRNPNVTTVFVDDTPPALFQFFPQGREINATFVDDRVGVNRSVVWYRVNEQPYVPLPLVERDGTWTITLPEAVKTDRICYYLQAWDRLDNTETFGNQTAPYACFDVSNHEPRVRIRAPADGSTVSRSFELTWEASDEDGDALVFTIYVRRPGQQNFAELTRIENTEARRYVIDSTRYPDGQYTFRVAAGDGGFVKLSETTVTILNKAEAVGRVTVTGDALPGSSMLVTAEITKAEAVVEARLYLGDDLVGSYPMNDQGTNGDVTAGDGTYSTLVPITAAGDYRVEIFTSYRENGETKESSVSNAATFSAKLTPAYILSEYAAIIALIGLLAAVGIGVGVFVVMRRR